MASRLRASNIDFVKGFFPDAVPAGVKYDAITFNDVFEHLPNLSVIVTAVRHHLNENGILIINLPVSDGFFSKLRAASRGSGPTVQCPECGKRGYLLRTSVIFLGGRFLSCICGTALNWCTRTIYLQSALTGFMIVSAMTKTLGP